MQILPHDENVKDITSRKHTRRDVTLLNIRFKKRVGTDILKRRTVGRTSDKFPANLGTTYTDWVASGGLLVYTDPIHQSPIADLTRCVNLGLEVSFLSDIESCGLKWVDGQTQL